MSAQDTPFAWWAQSVHGRIYSDTGGGMGLEWKPLYSAPQAGASQQAAPEPVPFMYAIKGLDGKVVMEEGSWPAESAAELSEAVFYLNEEQERGDYSVVPLFLAAPQAAPVEAGASQPAPAVDPVQQAALHQPVAGAGDSFSSLPKNNQQGRAGVGVAGSLSADEAQRSETFPDAADGGRAS